MPEINLIGPAVQAGGNALQSATDSANLKHKRNQTILDEMNELANTGKELTKLRAEKQRSLEENYFTITKDEAKTYDKAFPLPNKASWASFADKPMHKSKAAGLMALSKQVELDKVKEDIQKAKDDAAAARAEAGNKSKEKIAGEGDETKIDVAKINAEAREKAAAEKASKSGTEKPMTVGQRQQRVQADSAWIKKNLDSGGLPHKAFFGLGGMSGDDKLKLSTFSTKAQSVLSNADALVTAGQPDPLSPEDRQNYRSIIQKSQETVTSDKSQQEAPGNNDPLGIR
jgi:hypothetical protein